MKNIAVVLGDPRLHDPIKNNGKFNPEDIKTIEILKQALAEIPGYKFTYFDNHSMILDDLKNLSTDLGYPVDYILNFCDEGLNNNPLKEKDIPEHLEKINLPYTGGSPLCLKLCYNKFAVKRIALKNNIPVADGFLYNKKINKNLIFPMFVKPNYGDGSFGINNASVVNDYNELLKQVDWVKKKLIGINHKPRVLIEEYLPNEELSVAIIGNSNKLETKIIQEDLDVLTKGPKIISYEAKWNPDSEAWKKLISIEPKVDKETQTIIIENSIKLFRILKCRDYARFDWKLDKNRKPKFIDANPNCGWCYDGHLVKAFSLENYKDLEKNYSFVLKKILNAAEKRLNIFS